MFSALTPCAKIINQEDFVITTVALKCIRYCMLLSKTYVVNAIRMLAIPHQNIQI